MRLLAQDLIATGDLRPDITLDEVADVIWSMNSAEFYHLIVNEHSWSPDSFRIRLADSWSDSSSQPLGGPQNKRCRAGSITQTSRT